jgi:prephenate dehydratase
MVKSIAYLGPHGTYTETAALTYASILKEKTGQEYALSPYPSIAQTLYSTALGEATLAVVPVENSTEGSVTITLDTIWELNNLHIQQGLDLPVAHRLLSRGQTLKGIKTVYSHPQALAQCQKWLEKNLPQARLIATNSTTEAIQLINQEPTAGAISSPRASQLYDLPTLAKNINDYPDNCTRFWVVSLAKSGYGSHISLAFSFDKNVPGILVKPLQIFAKRNINLSRIESRPTKRTLGEYLFFIDLEGDMRETVIKTGLEELSNLTKELKIFGNYNVLKIAS